MKFQIYRIFWPIGSTKHEFLRSESGQRLPPMPELIETADEDEAEAKAERKWRGRRKNYLARKVTP